MDNREDIISMLITYEKEVSKITAGYSTINSYHINTMSDHNLVVYITYIIRVVAYGNNNDCIRNNLLRKFTDLLSAILYKIEKK